MTQPSIFITGAASGIGRAAAMLFAEHGWRVGLCDLSADRLGEVMQEIGAHSSVHAADVIDATAMRAAIIAFSGGETAPLDAIFNCAGILDMRMFGDASIKRLHAVIDVNVKGVINGLHGALPNLRAAPGARAISMSSGSAIYGTPEVGVYGASKFAIRGLTESLNIEFGMDDIWVADVMASYVRTPMVTEATHVAKSVGIVGVNLEPHDVAAIVYDAVTGPRKVHWFVAERDQEFAALIDRTPWEERGAIIRSVAGF